MHINVCRGEGFSRVSLSEGGIMVLMILRVGGADDWDGADGGMTDIHT